MISSTHTVANAISQKKQDGQRFFVALAGAPGAGKSTLANQLQVTFNQQGFAGVSILPMDGFHLDNSTLEARGQIDKKGAPQTFDVERFSKILAKLKKCDHDVWVPVFDRKADKVRTKGRIIDKQVEIIIVEGNYLFLNRIEWQKPAKGYDLTVFIDVPIPELEKRLVQRWLDHGLNLAAATARAHVNDMANAKTVLAESLTANICLSQHDTVSDNEGPDRC